METQEAKVIKLLEQRLKACRDAVGKQMLDGATSKLSSEGSSSRAANRNIVFELCLLQDTISKLLKPPFPEFETACNSISSWLEDPSASAKVILNTNAAKQTFVLQHEELLLQTADQLKHAKELLSSVSSAADKDFNTLQNRIEQIERRGNILSNEVLQMNQELHQLAFLFNKTVNMIAGTFKSWDEELQIMETEE